MPKLEVLTGNHADQMFVIESNLVRIGSDPHCEIHLKEPGISRFHAEIIFDHSGQFWLRDSGGPFGTFLNEQEIDYAPLQKGDIITLGRVKIRFSPERRDDSLNLPPSSQQQTFWHYQQRDLATPSNDIYENHHDVYESPSDIEEFDENYPADTENQPSFQTNFQAENEASLTSMGSSLPSEEYETPTPEEELNAPSEEYETPIPEEELNAPSEVGEKTSSIDDFQMESALLDLEAAENVSSNVEPELQDAISLNQTDTPSFQQAQLTFSDEKTQSSPNPVEDSLQNNDEAHHDDEAEQLNLADIVEELPEKSPEEARRETTSAFSDESTEESALSQPEKPSSQAFPSHFNLEDSLQVEAPITFDKESFKEHIDQVEKALEEGDPIADSISLKNGHFILEETEEANDSLSMSVEESEVFHTYYSDKEAQAFALAARKLHREEERVGMPVANLSAETRNVQHSFSKNPPNDVQKVSKVLTEQAVSQKLSDCEQREELLTEQLVKTMSELTLLKKENEKLRRKLSLYREILYSHDLLPAEIGETSE